MKVNNKILFCLWFIFELMMFVSLSITENLYLRISTANPFINASYWLSPVFAVIQTGNIIVAWGGIITGIFGSLIPIIYQSQSPIKTILFILKVNAVLILTSILTTFLFEVLYFPSKITFSIKIAYHSWLMFSGVLVFLTFWSFFGLGLRLTIGNGWLAAIICFVEQIFEHYFIFLYKPQLLVFLPYALSREIVIRNFPFWDTSSWASVKNTVAFASTSLILDSNFQPINVSYLWVFAFLMGYLIIMYLQPVRQIIIKKVSSTEVFSNAK